MKKNNKIIKILLSIFAIVSITIMFNYTIEKKSSQNQNNNKTQLENIENNISYDGKEGIDALSILKEKYPVEFQISEFGSFVTSINGQSAETNKNFWAFYVNGMLADKAADKFITKNTDKIEWKLEEIKEF